MLLKDLRVFPVADNDGNVSGFSFVELMVVIAIIGVISAFSLPGYIASMPKRRLKAATRELYGVMQQARLMAVKDNQYKRLRFRENYCYLDDNNNRNYDADEKRLDLAKYHDIQFGCGATEKKWDNKGTVSQASIISFSPTGTTNSRTAYLQNITSPSECFAVTAQTSGSLKIRWFDGKQWK